MGWIKQSFVPKSYHIIINFPSIFLFSGNIVKEYEDDIPFDGNGVINPRKSVNEDKGIQFRGIVSDDSRNGLSDDEDFPIEGSGTNDSLIFPNDPRWWSAKHDKNYFTPSGILKRMHATEYVSILNLHEQFDWLIYMFSIKYDWLIWFIFHQW